MRLGLVVMKVLCRSAAVTFANGTVAAAFTLVPTATAISTAAAAAALGSPSAAVQRVGRDWSLPKRGWGRGMGNGPCPKPTTFGIG